MFNGEKSLFIIKYLFKKVLYKIMVEFLKCYNFF